MLPLGLPTKKIPSALYSYLKYPALIVHVTLGQPRLVTPKCRLTVCRMLTDVILSVLLALHWLSDYIKIDFTAGILKFGTVRLLLAVLFTPVSLDKSTHISFIISFISFLVSPR